MPSRAGLAKERQAAIEKVLRHHRIGNQMELLEKLQAHGIRVTQSSVSRDLQLMKKPLSRSFDSARATARLFAHAVPRLAFDAGRMKAAMDPGLYAAERAYRLVKERGLSFREAYRPARDE